jgi:rubrerythrin
VIAKELTGLEALGVAVRRELDAQQIFRDLAAACSNPLARERFQLLANEARHYEALLRSRHAELFPDVELSLPPSMAPVPVSAGAGAVGGLREALRLASDAERQAREFFLDAAAGASDPSGQAMFRYLAGVHAQHHMQLASEYELVLQYPNAYDDPETPWRTETRDRGQ